MKIGLVPYVFEALSWNYDIDKTIGVDDPSMPIEMLKQWTVRHQVGLLVGYLEKAGDKLFSSYMLVEAGAIKYNYKRMRV